MVFAPFPAALYLSDGSRTEGEMKTAFENWLLATQHTGGHGECQLQYVSPTQIRLVTYNGRRVIVGADPVAVLVPYTGVYLTNAGLLASTVYLVALLIDGTLFLVQYGGTVFMAPDPDSGVMQIGHDGVSLNPALTLVGAIATTASGTFSEDLTCSWFGRRLLTTRAYPAGPTLSATTETLLWSELALVWPGDALTFGAQWYANNGTAAAVNASFAVYLSGASVHGLSVTVPAFSNVPIHIQAAAPGVGGPGQSFCEVRGSVSAGSLTLYSPMLTVTRYA